MSFRLLLLLVIAGVLPACDAGSDHDTTRAVSVAEGLVYRASAVLARAGIRAYCTGVRQEGLSVQIDSCELATKSRLIRARFISLGLAGEPTRLPLYYVPALSISVGDVAMVQRSGSSGAQASKVVAKTKPVPWFLRAMPVHADLHRVRVQSLPVEIGASLFGWPFAESPRGEAHAVALGTPNPLRVSLRARKDRNIVGRVIVSAPDLTQVTGILGRRSDMLAGGNATTLIEFDIEDGAAIAKLAGNATQLCVAHHRFGDGRACGVGAKGAMRFGANRHQLYVDFGELSFGQQQQVQMVATGAIPLDAVGGRLDVDVRIPPQPVERVLAAIPTEWRTGLKGFDLDGQFSARFRWSDELIEPTFAFEGVAVRNAPPGQDPRRLNGPCTWKVAFPYAHTISLSPEDGFVPVSQLPTVLVDAVRISEDASFFQHDGFDRTEIAKALTDLKSGNGARGASTISQQLAKNLYFDGDRNLTRKVEEAIATAALEASVPKWRLLEIYLNLIEWGEGVFGINAAAHRYFGKSPYALDAKEAAFLAGIIPAPRKVDREMGRDGQSPWAEKRAERVTRFLCEVGKVDGPECLLSQDPIADVPPEL